MHARILGLVHKIVMHVTGSQAVSAAGQDTCTSIVVAADSLDSSRIIYVTTMAEFKRYYSKAGPVSALLIVV